MIINDITLKFTDWLMAFFGLSSIFMTFKMFIVDQLPNIPEVTNSNSLIVVLGTYLSLVLTALWKQSSNIKNIDENIDKQQKSIAETLEVLKNTLKKDDERHEIIVKVLKSIEEKEDEQVDLLKDTGSHPTISRRKTK